MKMQIVGSFGHATLKVRDFLVDFFMAFTWRRAIYFSVALHVAFLFFVLLSGIFKRNPFADKIVNLNLLPPMQVVEAGAPEPAKAEAVKSILPPKEEIKKDDIYEVKKKKTEAKKEIKKADPPKKKEPSAEEKRRALEKKLAAIDKQFKSQPSTATPVANASPFGAQGGVSTSQYFPHNWYLRGLQTKITNAWQEPSGFSRLENRRALVSFTIARDGSVTNILLKGSSGDEQLDRSALDAVRAAQPFSPLPDEYKQASLDVAIQFEVTP